MLVITGIFDDGRFIPDKPVSIPQNKKVIVTILPRLRVRLSSLFLNGKLLTGDMNSL